MRVQGTAVYLACDEDSSYVTGAIMNVTGKHLAFLKRNLHCSCYDTQMQIFPLQCWFLTSEAALQVVTLSARWAVDTLHGSAGMLEVGCLYLMLVVYRCLLLLAPR